MVILNVTVISITVEKKREMSVKFVFNFVCDVFRLRETQNTSA